MPRQVEIIRGYKLNYTDTKCKHAPNCFECPFEDCVYSYKTNETMEQRKKRKEIEKRYREKHKAELREKKRLYRERIKAEKERKVGFDQKQSDILALDRLRGGMDES